MQWPEITEVEQMTQQDRSARHAAQMIGTENIDEMVARAWAAKNATAVEADTP